MSNSNSNRGRFSASNPGRPYVKASETINGIPNVNPGQWVKRPGSKKLYRLGANLRLVPPTSGRDPRVSMHAFRSACLKPASLVYKTRAIPKAPATARTVDAEPVLV